MAEAFLDTLFALAAQRWYPAGAAVNGGQPLSGPPDCAELSAGGWWECELDIGTLYEKIRLRQWRAFVGRLKSGGAQIVVPVLDFSNPFPDAALNGDGGVPHSDGTSFSDGSLYQTQTISYSLSGAASLRDNSITVLRKFGGIVKGGEFFTLVGSQCGERLHCVSQVSSVAGDLFTIDVYPPLREDYDDETEVDFENPRCRMRLSPESLPEAWPKIHPPFEMDPSITFIEDGT